MGASSRSGQSLVWPVVGVIVGSAVGYTVFRSARTDGPEPAVVSSGGGATSQARTVPKVQFRDRLPAEQPARAATGPADSRVTDGREKRAGAKLHSEVKPLCSDKKCMYGECSSRCTEWIKKTYTPEEMSVERHRQQLFFNCVGFCLDPLEDAGSPK